MIQFFTCLRLKKIKFVTRFIINIAYSPTQITRAKTDPTEAAMSVPE